MMKSLSILVFGVTGLLVIPAMSASSQEPRPAVPSQLEKSIQAGQRAAPEPPPPPQVPGAAVSERDEWLAAILGFVVPKLDPAALAGMASGSKPAVLSLEQAYALTLIRARTPGARLAVRPAEGFDPKALDEQATRSGAGDFDRFRREFLASGFRDPAPGFLAALRHRDAADSAQNQVAFAENMHRLYQELIRGETSGVSQLQIDQVNDYLQITRQALAVELTAYRSAVDELRVSLGLPPETPIVPDERILAPFTTAFAAFDAWQRNPRHLLNELAGLRDRLPRLEELKIGGHSLALVVQGTLSEEPFLLTCVEAARNHHSILRDGHSGSDDRNALALRIRRSVRALILTHKNYELERTRLELALREVDQRFEQIAAPSVGGVRLAQSINAAVHTTAILASQSRLYRGRTQLVSLWLQFKEQSLALDRELGAMSYDNWDAFHRSFLPEPGLPAPGDVRSGN